MSKQATEIASRIHEALETSIDSNPNLEQLISSPGQPKALWPRADISGLLKNGEMLIVEIDDHADPARSVVKYWPLLHALPTDDLPYDSIAFAEVSRPDDTYGAGYRALAEFIGQRFTEIYPDRFRFRYIDLGDGDPDRIAQAILAFLSEGSGNQS